MTPQELRTLIESDAQALALAKSGAADLCAARCMQVAPKIPASTLLTELSILRVYANPADGEAVLQQFETVAASNPVVARVLKWIRPGAPGVDFGDVRVRAMLTLAVNQGGIGLTNVQATPLLAAAEVSQSISGSDVSTAYPF